MSCPEAIVWTWPSSLIRGPLVSTSPSERRSSGSRSVQDDNRARHDPVFLISKVVLPGFGLAGLACTENSSRVTSTPPLPPPLEQAVTTRKAADNAARGFSARNIGHRLYMSERGTAWTYSSW